MKDVMGDIKKALKGAVTPKKGKRNKINYSIAVLRRVCK